MYKKAIQAAEDSLKNVEASIKAMEAAKDFKQFSEAWTNFLMPAGRIFSKLEEGSKSNSKSVGWFSQRKRERKTDPLLNYLRVARNADEHGLQEVARHEPGHFSIGGDIELNGGIGPGQNLNIRQIGPRPPTLGVKPSRIALTTVVDKYKIPAEPPISHLGEKLQNPEAPLEVAKFALSYFTKFITEAAKLPE